MKDAEITLVHRRAPGDKRAIGGEDTTKTDSGFMQMETGLGTVKIPYHRILKIETLEKVVWERR